MVRVISCRFMRLSCSEDDHPLFRQYYARSNRERGVKLLRCFPHCCPEHIQRCYCGSSVHALVTFDAEQPVSSQKNLVVCARFEPSRVVPLWPVNLPDAPREGNEDHVQEKERKLEPGEVISLPLGLLAPSSRQEEQTLWIRADREGESKQQALPKNAALYVLNNHRFPKWFYNYDSSITRTQREMTHHLALYVFQLTDTRSQSGGIDALVLARHQSPGFKVISYRRSGNNSSDAGCDLPALDVAGDAFTAISVNSPDTSTTSDMDIDSSGVPAAGMSSEDVLNLETKADRPESTTVSQLPSVAEAFGHESTESATNTAFWEYDNRARPSGMPEKAKHLLILWRFLNCVSLSDAGISVDALLMEIRTHWLRVASALRAPPDRITTQLEGVLSSFLLGMCTGSSSCAYEQHLPRDLLVMQAVTHLLLRALSSRAVRYAFRSAFTVEDGVMDQPRLRERFITLVLNLYDVLDDLFQLESSNTFGIFSEGHFTLPTLVDEVLSLIYRQRRLSALRSEVSGLLMGHHLQTEAVDILFHAFTDQTRELIIAAGGRGTSPRSSGATNAQTLWTRRWLLEPGSIQMNAIPHDRKLPMQPSLVNLVQWLHEFACVDVAVRADGSHFSMRSMIPLVSNLSPMELVLDRRLRYFRVTPGGISSMMSISGGWAMGDYVASFNSNDVIEMDFYAYQEESSAARYCGGDQMNSKNNHNDFDPITRVRRLRMTLSLEENINVTTTDPQDLFIVFHGIVSDASHAMPSSHSRSQNGSRFYLSEMSAAERSTVLRELQWTPQTEINGGYVAVPATSRGSAHSSSSGHSSSIHYHCGINEFSEN